MATPGEILTTITVSRATTLTIQQGPNRRVTTTISSEEFANGASANGRPITDVIVNWTETGPSDSTASSQQEKTSSIVSSIGPGGSSAPDKSTETRTTSPTAASESSPDGLKGGAVAGVAIGCLIAGLALGLIAAFLLLRRRRRGKTASEGFASADQKYTEPKDGTQVTVSPSRHDAELNQFLLEASPDKELQAELRSLSELIYQHVENYYRGPQVQADPAEVAQSLINIGYSSESSGLQTDTVAAVCLNPKTSQTGLRHVLSHVIFRSLDFSSGGSLSMLPLAVAALAQESHSAENANSPAISLARSRWRSLSALLLHPNPGERTPLPVSVTEASPKALALANGLNMFLKVFITQDPASQQDQTNHLQAVILECTKLGYIVLSQPSDWGFVFSNTSVAKGRRIVVCPGLERRSDNDGTRYRSPKEVVAPETMPL
ncbi:hypothetical protein IL306_000464 [Fusarium sp. DS 682]|nr:hypothetical protein IL306_000464 [Fusarium sp. DS 682]